MFGYLDGQLEHGSIQQFYKNVDTVGGDENFRARIDVVALEETIAVVRVLEENWGGRIDFTDYLLLLKIEMCCQSIQSKFGHDPEIIGDLR